MIELQCGFLRVIDDPKGEVDPLGNKPQITEVCVAPAGHEGDHTWADPHDGDK